MNTLKHLKIKSFSSHNGIKYYIKLDFEENEILPEILIKYKAALDFIKRNNITPVFEKIFGSLSVYNDFDLQRKYYFNEMKMSMPPFSFIEGEQVNKSIAGILFYGMVTINNDVKIDYYKKDNIVIGTTYQTPNSRYLYLYGLKNNNSNETKSTYENLKEFFNRIELYIIENNFLPKDILRTWIYVSDINKDYADFNKARKEFFEKNEIGYSSDFNELPASTCIGGSSPESKFSINLVCADKKEMFPKIKRIYNELQNEAEGNAYLFRPTFSRALLVEDENFSELQISGTASINDSGETVYKNDPYNQIKKTILNVSALLRQTNQNFNDLCESTCFFKKPEYFNYYTDVLHELRIDIFPSTFIIGDICRDDLLFEFDGVAIKSKNKDTRHDFTIKENF
jgi:enamine deaminase RidA (YjgF/YER057c/UK114 family)